MSRTCWPCSRRAWTSVKAPTPVASRRLLQIAGAEPRVAVAELRERVKAEPQDDSLEALDKIWEEEAVDFMKAEQQDRCSSLPSAPGKARDESAVPLPWVDFQHEEADASASRGGVEQCLNGICCCSGSAPMSPWRFAPTWQLGTL